MDKAHDRGRLDWLIELAGALVPATAAAFAGARLAPVHGWPMATGVLVGFSGVFALVYCAVRLVPAEARILGLRDFDCAMLSIDVLADDVLWLDDVLEADELLLDQVWVGPQALEPSAFQAASDAVAELLLDDALPAATPDSRVVQLFADGRMPTAGQLKLRIDRHLADGDQPAMATRDASDALNEALAELRRSLRQA